MAIRPVTLAFLAGLLAALTVLGACSSGDDDDDDASGGDTQRIAVKLTNDGCDPSEVEAHTGPTTFEVTNDGAAGVTELEVMEGDKILGEVENIIEGLNGSFTLNLRAGEYTLYCPGGDNERGTLTVTGDNISDDEDPDLAAAVIGYRDYVAGQTEELVTASEALRDAIESGDVESSKTAYIEARPYYERIEPIAESFGDLDPAIDARADDVTPEELTGFHRIEYALWVENTTDGMSEVADQLIADVTTLRDRIPDLEIDALQTANGAVELLGEVTASKITGEEERYSHIDILDFHANVEGAKAAFDAVRGGLVRRDPDLATTLDERFADVFAALDDYRDGDGFVLYTELNDDDTRVLGQVVDALGEPLSEVAVALSLPPDA